MLVISNLLLEMLERISLVAISGYMLTQTTVFHQVLTRKIGSMGNVVIILLFSSMGIFCSYAGVPIHDAIANSREVIIMLCGLLFGPIIGTVVGIITGIHRYTMGGFTALPCSLSCIFSGLISGFVCYYYQKKKIPWIVIFTLGITVNILQMVMILLTAYPFSRALELVNTIGLPMTAANSMGLVIFMVIVRRAFEQEDRISAEQSHRALHIANHTLPYLRTGLTEKNAQAAVNIILQTTDYQAVALTNTTEVLGFAGVESAHHGPHRNAGLTSATCHTLKTGKITVAANHEEIGCSYPGCKLASAIVVPLFKRNHLAGTLKMYYTQTNAISHSDFVFAKDIGTLFSTQLDLAELDNQSKLADKAKLMALHMQINPHFLFNTLNTISSLIRTQPDTARHILTKLSALFRFSLQKTGKIISIREELFQVHAYLEIAKIRDGDKLSITEHIDPEIFSYGIPSLTLQPLVENALQHGLHKKENGGTLSIKGFIEEDTLCFIIHDDGIGMTVTNEIFKERQDHIGLYNVNARLQGLYGDHYGLKIESTAGQGTTVFIHLPKQLLPTTVSKSKEVIVHA